MCFPLSKWEAIFRTHTKKGYLFIRSVLKVDGMIQIIAEAFLELEILIILSLTSFISVHTLKYLHSLLFSNTCTPYYSQILALLTILKYLHSLLFSNTCTPYYSQIFALLTILKFLHSLLFSNTLWYWVDVFRWFYFLSYSLYEYI
jgi:hypothetical protein